MVEIDDFWDIDYDELIGLRDIRGDKEYVKRNFITGEEVEEDWRRLSPRMINYLGEGREEKN
ncbi:MAG: hypothetical protein Q8L29_03810 [archaeon]|nr:hypothetical protein [archaeon]